MDAHQVAFESGWSRCGRHTAGCAKERFDADSMDFLMCLCVILGSDEYTGGFVCVSVDFSMALEWLVQQPCLPTFWSDTREFWRKGHD